jgi:hypothetical protein
MAFLRYARMALIVDSGLQQEVRDVNVNLDSKAQIVETLTKGFSGVTPGAKVIEIEGKWALPVAGQEFDVATAISKLDIHTVQVPIGNKTILSTGVFMSGSVSGSVNANTEVSGKFTGTYDDPQ